MRLAVIGAGYWGPNLVRVFQQNNKVDSVVVCEIDEARRARIQTLFPTVELQPDLDRVLDDTSVEAVVVALPVDMHYRVAKQALLAGKHVLVEKPLATNVAEAEELCQLAQTHGRTLMVGHTFLFNGAVRKIKEYIEAGDLGEVYYIYGQRLNLGIVRQDVDAMWNLAPHDVSIVLHWLGDTPVEVAYQGASYLQNGIDDVSFMTLRFAGGTIAHLHVSWLDPNKVRKMTVVGSSKMVVYDDVSAERRVQLFDKGIDRKHTDRSLGRFESFAQFQLLQRAGDLVVPKVAFPEPLAEEAAHFVECIQQDKRPLADGINGLNVIRVLEAANASRANLGKPASIDLSAKVGRES